MAQNVSSSLSSISVIVAVQASFFEGINFLPSRALISVDFPELIVAITFIGKTELLILSNALTSFGSLKSSIPLFLRS